MKTKHTPGPWEHVPKLSGRENHRGFFVRAEKPAKDGKWALAEVQPGDEDGIIGAANARLIAAAPELLASAQAMLSRYKDAHDSGDWGSWDLEDDAEYVALRAAIAKATGAAE